jgi:polar amino acid transport system substrate-binding protein
VLTGERILLHFDAMKDVAKWVRHHHERWDGLGYPDGLRGEAIPFASRVIGVADCVDAMLSDRPYRDALTPAKVIKVLVEEQGRQFDPVVTERAIAFLVRQEAERAVEDEERQREGGEGQAEKEDVAEEHA